MTESTAAPRRRRLPPLPMQMMLGLLGGLAVGLLWPKLGAGLQPFGTAFIEAIKMVVIPLVFSAVTLGVARMGSELNRFGRVAVLALGWFMFATLVSIVIGLALNGIFHPGAGASLASSGKLPGNLASSVDWTKYFLDLIPANVLAVMAAQKVLPTIVFAVLFGMALASLGPRARPITDGLQALLDAMFKLTQWIVAFAPLAVFAVMAWLFATQGLATIGALAKLIGVMYIGIAIAIMMSWIALWLIGERPLAVTRKVMEPLILGFTTRSSEVTLPVHMEKLKSMGAPDRVVSVVLPLGYSFNLDGSSLYIALAVTFLAEAYGLQLDWPALATILLTTLIASKGIANVPSGGLVALATVTTAIGLPVEAIAIIAGVDAFMDMGRTAVNVFGNTVAVLLVKNAANDVEEEQVVAVSAEDNRLSSPA